MKNKQITLFWIGFMITAGLTAWLYWLWRQKRVVAPKPLVVSGRLPARPARRSVTQVGSRESVMGSDALEEIKGIGPVFANRLNEAGIDTYEQLASTSPEELARITGVTRWDPADWIQQATELAKTK